MVIGAVRLSFVIPPNSQSLRGLSQKARSAVNSRFKAAAAELTSEGKQGSELVIGVSLVSTDEAQTRKRVDEIVNYFQGWGHADLAYHENEIIHFEDIAIERDFEKYDP
jgi:uncharacterized protein YlxP (DUF503 family)